MDRYFRQEDGSRVNIVEHTLEQIQKWPNLKIYLATDSQDEGQVTVYATVIVYRYGRRGAHFIYFKEEVPRIRDMYTRLYNEGVRTIEAADILSKDIPIQFAGLEFDYNYIPKWASHKLISAIGGWVKGLNYKAIFKNTGDYIMIASKAADHVCRNNGNQYK